MVIKRFMSILAILCVLGVALAVPTTVAHAQANTQAQSASNVTCWGDWCSGQDPHATHCDADAVTIASVTATAGNTQLSDDTNRKGTLEVRYSPTCKTKWSRLSLTRDADYAELVIHQDDQYTQSKFLKFFLTTYAKTGVFYTPMIYSVNHRVFAMIDGADCGLCATSWV